MYLRSTNFRHYTVAFLMLLLSVIVIPTTFAQSQNLCRENIQTIEYGDTVTAEIDDDLSPVVFYCFDAERGDTVTVFVEPLESLRADLIPLVLITEPIISSFEAMGEDLDANALNGGNATRPLEAVEVTAEIDADGTYLIAIGSTQGTQGEFDLTLEVEAGQSILGASDIGNSDDEEDESDDSSTSQEEIILGETNLCSLDITESLGYNQSVRGVLMPNLPQALFCFEGNEGDIVQIRVGTVSGSLVPFFFLADPFWDGTDSTIIAQDVASNPSDTAQIIYELPQDGAYFVFIQPADNNLGEFYIDLSLVDEDSPSLGCENEPLNILSRYPWVVSSDESSEAVITINVSCVGLVLVDVLGAGSLYTYDFNQDDALTFVMGDETVDGNIEFTTVSVDEDNWIMENENGETITLQRLDVESCTEGLLPELTRGTWFGGGSNLGFDFMCDDVVVILLDNQIIIGDYLIEDGTLVLFPNSERETRLGEIEIDNGELILVQDEGVLQFVNIIASDDSADDDASDDSANDDASDDSADDDASDENSNSD